MTEKILSIFIDESGDFGAFSGHSPYYIVSMVIHDQKVSIKESISALESRVEKLGFDPKHAIHTGALIRRESIYARNDTEERKRLFNAVFNFARRLDVRYMTSIIRKSECTDVISMTAKLSKTIAAGVKKQEAFLNGFDMINIYYDNGQIELTKIITSVFGALYPDVEFRKVRPADYKLFQVADLVCTVELLAEKAEHGGFSNSEKSFFYSVRDFKKNYIKSLT